MAVKETKRMQEVTDKEYTCDVCGRVCSGRVKCSICGCDLCSDCIRGPKDEREWTRYCPHCWNIGVPYRAKICTVYDTYLTEKAQIIKDWTEEAKKGR